MRVIPFDCIGQLFTFKLGFRARSRLGYGNFQEREIILNFSASIIMNPQHNKRFELASDCGLVWRNSEFYFDNFAR